MMNNKDMVDSKRYTGLDYKQTRARTELHELARARRLARGNEQVKFVNLSFSHHSESFALPPLPAPMASSSFVTLDTSVGPLTLELYTAHAPKVCTASCHLDFARLTHSLPTDM